MPAARRTWTLGDRLTHRHNPELGIGRVVEVQDRAVVAEFPDGTRLRLAEASDALVPMAEEDRVPLDSTGALVQRLAAGAVDPLADFAMRLDALHLAALREAGGLGSFLGGRMRLFPHQIHVAERASASDPVRWLLADEVGLGKTVEACLILNRLLRTGRVERVLIVAPETLTVQWLGELWRKYHQVFALLDEARLADVARDFGPDFNPFDVHRRAVIALETLIARPRLTEQAVEAGIDLVVVDEAHRLRRPPGHAGDRSWRAVAPIAGARPPRAPADRDAVRGRRPRVLPTAPAPAPGRVSGRGGLRGAARARGAAAALHELDPARRHRGPAPARRPGRRCRRGERLERAPRPRGRSCAARPRATLSRAARRSSASGAASAPAPPSCRCSPPGRAR